MEVTDRERCNLRGLSVWLWNYLDAGTDMLLLAGSWDPKVVLTRGAFPGLDAMARGRGPARVETINSVSIRNEIVFEVCLMKASSKH